MFTYAPFRLGLFDELDALYPDSNPQDGHHSYQISCASCSFAGAHLMITDVMSGDVVTFEVKGPHKRFMPTSKHMILKSDGSKAFLTNL